MSKEIIKTQEVMSQNNERLDQKDSLTSTLGGIESFGGLKEASLEAKQDALQSHAETVRKLVVNTNMKHGFNGPKMNFSSIVDKALYIVGKKNSSENDRQYLDFLQFWFPDTNDQILIEAGQKLRKEYVTPKRNNSEITVPTLFLDLTLSKQLTGAKPNYSGTELSFATDIDKALYIVAQEVKSKRNKDYLKFLKAQFSHHQFENILSNKVTDAQLMERGKKVKEKIAKKVDSGNTYIDSCYTEILAK